MQCALSYFYSLFRLFFVSYTLFSSVYTMFQKLTFLFCEQNMTQRAAASFVNINPFVSVLML